MLKITEKDLGVLLIAQGLFLLFALAFNGTVGETFVNWSFSLSGLSMIACGSFKIAKADFKVMAMFGLVSLVFYLPMIWQRFNYSSSIDVIGLCFDIWIIAIAIITIIYKGKSDPL